MFFFVPFSGHPLKLFAKHGFYNAKKSLPLVAFFLL